MEANAKIIIIRGTILRRIFGDFFHALKQFHLSKVKELYYYLEKIYYKLPQGLLKDLKLGIFIKNL